jgi:hypothetical protein
MSLKSLKVLFKISMFDLWFSKHVVNGVKIDFNIALLFNSSGNSAITNLRNCSTDRKLGLTFCFLNSTS